MAEIDYYFTASSPWVYLGHAAIRAVAQRHGARLNPRPVQLGGVWEVSGAVPLAQRTPTRQRYRFLELQRFAELRSLPMVYRPKAAPLDPTLPDLTVAAILVDGDDPLDFMAGLFSAFWAEDRNIADGAVVAAILKQHGLDPAAVMARAGSDAAATLRRENTQAAIAAGAIGVPAYVLDGEVFWGQDRIDLLDRALSTGRAPYEPL